MSYPGFSCDSCFTTLHLLALVLLTPLVLGSSYFRLILALSTYYLSSLPNPLVVRFAAIGVSSFDQFKCLRSSLTVPSVSLICLLSITYYAVSLSPNT